MTRDFKNKVREQFGRAADGYIRDKGFATELVYGSTRMRRKLDHLVDRFLLEPPPPSARAALRIGAHQLLHLDTPPHAEGASRATGGPASSVATASCCRQIDSI